MKFAFVLFETPIRSKPSRDEVLANAWNSETHAGLEAWAWRWDNTGLAVARRWCLAAELWRPECTGWKRPRLAFYGSVFTSFNSTSPIRGRILTYWDTDVDLYRSVRRHNWRIPLLF
ncbi:hypothetical protein OH76DRAFT_208793 [Lentinus brumalis]|uniref:Uncharacterized protein n=1 Tax=Lentinus brumalis TaxID=2498619 RepID=A0A371DIJ0_9APHY|nr:hypothetical protein OH76DRAFT_208793 [Polyporus brumalis]